jgi:hypothetical protein|tara:strand:- start:3806 stop:3964 length:159 start_codon:yes stop_codon:yes gene_type:complete
MAAKKKEYTVCGNHAVFGNEPGSTFSSDMSDDDAQRLIDGGHLAGAKRPQEG